MNIESLHKKLNETIYDYIFPVKKTQFYQYKRTQFEGTYLVDWGSGRKTIEVI